MSTQITSSIETIAQIAGDISIRGCYICGSPYYNQFPHTLGYNLKSNNNDSVSVNVDDDTNAADEDTNAADEETMLMATL